VPSGARAELPLPGGIDPAKGGTIELWARLPPDRSPDEMCVFFYYGESNATESVLLKLNPSTPLLTAGVWNGSLGPAPVHSEIYDFRYFPKDWTHLVFAFSADEQALFRDGELCQSSRPREGILRFRDRYDRFGVAGDVIVDEVRVSSTVRVKRGRPPARLAPDVLEQLRQLGY
jgi:hypothetical protein